MNAGPFAWISKELMDKNCFTLIYIINGKKGYQFSFLHVSSFIDFKNEVRLLSFMLSIINGDWSLLFLHISMCITYSHHIRVGPQIRPFSFYDYTGPTYECLHSSYWIGDFLHIGIYKGRP